MSPKRLLILAAIAAATIAGIVAMVRYTHRVEERLAHASASGATITFLRERANVPPFTAPDLAGRQISTEALRGKVVLVNFWATWCPPCREEIPDLVALQRKYPEHLQIIGISQDSAPPSVVQQFAAARGMNYPTVMSTPEIEKLFPGVYALPTTFLIDREGRLAKKHIGMLNASLIETETRALAGLEVDANVELVDDEDKVRLENAAQANKIPGIDLSVLTPEQKTRALQTLNTERCTCGCALTVAQCRVDDPNCTVSLPLAKDIVKKIAAAK
jgi:thiol-disulfide isomerase/thioredoxin